MSESTWTRELNDARSVSCSKLLPRDCVLTAVMAAVSLSIVNVEMKPSLSLPSYAKAIVVEFTCTREFSFPRWVSCSKLLPSDCVSTAVMAAALSIVNVEMKPFSKLPAYAKAIVVEFTCTRELYCPWTVSCSKLLPRDCVSTAVMLPLLSMVNVEMKPLSPLPAYAKA